jgi:hypothetical protein
VLVVGDPGAVTERYFRPVVLVEESLLRRWRLSVLSGLVVVLVGKLHVTLQAVHVAERLKGAACLLRSAAVLRQNGNGFLAMADGLGMAYRTRACSAAYSK